MALQQYTGPPLIPPKRDKSVPTTPVLNNNHPHLSSANSSFATKSMATLFV